MKRFHVHLHVDDLAKSIGFYSKLFAAEPARLEGDYAKWMLDDPPVNFAISTRGAQARHRPPRHPDRRCGRTRRAEGARRGGRHGAARRGRDDLLLRAQREALGHRPAGHRLGALPHAGQHPGVQRSGRPGEHAVRVLRARPRPTAAIAPPLQPPRLQRAARRHRAASRSASRSSPHPVAAEGSMTTHVLDPVHPQLGAQRAGRGHAQPLGGQARPRREGAQRRQRTQRPHQPLRDRSA